MQVLSKNTRLKRINLSHIILFESNQQTIVDKIKKVPLEEADHNELVATNTDITYDEDYLTEEA